MKKLFIAIVALAAAAACSNEEIVSVNREAIAFDNAFVNNATRVKVDHTINGDNIKNDYRGFGVYGFVTGTATAPIFTNEAVTWGTVNNVSGWYHNTVQYWINGANYNFAAIAPYSDTTVNSGLYTVTEATPSKTVLTYTNECLDTELLYATATATGSADGNAAVAFNFRHILSKVKFTFKNKYNATNTEIGVKYIYIKDAYNTATATLTSDSTVWSGHDKATNLSTEYQFGNAGTTNSNSDPLTRIPYNGSAESYYAKFLIPAGDANDDGVLDTLTYKVDFDIDLFVNGVLVKTFKHSYDNHETLTFSPKPGYYYNIVVEITPDNIDKAGVQKPIEFTVNEIAEWDTDVNGNGQADDDVNM